MTSFLRPLEGEVFLEEINDHGAQISPWLVRREFGASRECQMPDQHLRIRWKLTRSGTQAGAPHNSDRWRKLPRTRPANRRRRAMWHRELSTDPYLPLQPSQAVENIRQSNMRTTAICET
jgi:hypothetical protein